jgi:hypothetical protein
MAESRYLYGDTNPVVAPVATAQAIALGDMVGINTGTLVRAEDETWVTDEATTRTNFVARFLGRAAQRKLANEDTVYGNGFANEIRVDTTGIYEYDCVTASYTIGDRIGPAKQAGLLLESQKVKAVTPLAESTGRVEKSAVSATRLWIRLISSLLPLAE